MWLTWSTDQNADQKYRIAEVLDSIFKKAGLIIRPVEQRMDLRDAGLHVRKSMLGSQVIQHVITYFQKIMGTQN